MIETWEVDQRRESMSSECRSQKLPNGYQPSGIYQSIIIILLIQSWIIDAVEDGLPQEVYLGNSMLEIA